MDKRPDKRRRSPAEVASGAASTATDAEDCICRYCSKRCSTFKGLRVHIDSVHNGATPATDSLPEACGGGCVRQSRWDDELILKLARGRVTHHVPREFASGIKDQFARTVATLKEEVLSRVQRVLEPGVDADTLVGDIFEVCSDLTARDSELDRLRASPAYVRPEKRYLGTNPVSGEAFYAYDNPLDKVLEAMFATQPETYRDVKDFYKSRILNGRLRKDEAYDADMLIADTVDGCAAGSYVAQFLFNDGEVPLIFIFYYDGLEVVNGIGQARLTHELGCFYWALVPLQQHYRLNSSHLRVATLCLKRAINEIGMETVIHGRKEDQGDDKCNAWGVWMSRLKRRITVKTPDGEAPGRGGTVLLAADTPAAAEVLGTKKAVGPKTKSVCRGCHCHQWEGRPDSPHRKPNSFLAGLPGWAAHCEKRKQNFTLRSDEDLHAFLAKAQAVLNGEMGFTEIKAWYQSMGVNDFAGALARTGCPMDIMHILAEGIARQQLGALAYFMTTKWGVCPFNLANRLGEFTKEEKWSRKSLPYVNSSRAKHLTEGEAGGIPAGDASFPGTAGQLSTLILHIQKVFGPLVGDAYKRDPVWQVSK